MKLMPAIDLRNGRVVRLEQGDDARRTTYDADPVAMLERFSAAGVDWVHIVDLDGAFGETPQRPLLAQLAARGRALGLQIEIGGGFRDHESVAWALEDARVARVVLGSLALRDPDGFATLAADFPHRLVPALETKDGALRDAGWLRAADERPEDAARRMGDLPCAAVLVTDISRDGLLGGPNLDLARDIGRWSGLPAILSGGVSRLGDLEAARQVPEIGYAIVGKALYDGRIDLAEAVETCAAETCATETTAGAEDAS